MPSRITVRGVLVDPVNLSVNGEFEACPHEAGPTPSSVPAPDQTALHARQSAASDQVPPDIAAGGDEQWNMQRLEEMMLQEAMARSLEESDAAVAQTLAAQDLDAPPDNDTVPALAAHRELGGRRLGLNSAEPMPTGKCGQESSSGLRMLHG